MIGAPAHFLTRVDQTTMPWKQKDVHTLTNMQPTKKDGASCTIPDLYSGDSLNLNGTVTILSEAFCSFPSTKCLDSAYNRITIISSILFPTVIH
jgi:hypothetical protein